MTGKLSVIHSYPIWLPQTQTWMYNQVKYLPDTIKAIISCEHVQNLDQFELPRIYASNSPLGLHYFLSRTLRKLGIQYRIGPITNITKQEGATVLHSHFGTTGWHNLIAAKRNQLKHVVTFYGLDVNKVPQQHPVWRKRYTQLFEEADLFLCEGPYMARSLAAQGCPANKIRVHHLGIPLENLSFQPRKWRQGETLRVLIVASFREKKGIPDALLALGKIKDQVDLEITIIGDASKENSSQNEKRRILTLIESLELTSRVRLLGYQPYKVILAEAFRHHIFLSPSVTASDGDSEGGAPVVLIEMMATGMPIVSTTHCDIPEVVEYGKKDWLVAEHDVDALANRLIWLIEHPGEWTQLTQQGRYHVERHFDASVQGLKLSEIYFSLIN